MTPFSTNNIAKRFASRDKKKAFDLPTDYGDEARHKEPQTFGDFQSDGSDNGLKPSGGDEDVTSDVQALAGKHGLDRVKEALDSILNHEKMSSLENDARDKPDFGTGPLLHDM